MPDLRPRDVLPSLTVEKEDYSCMTQIPQIMDGALTLYRLQIPRSGLELWRGIFQ